MRVFVGVVGFEWDDGNRDKNLIKHSVTSGECEEVFQDANRQFYPDVRHSGAEERYVVVGATKDGRILRIAFTTRRDHIRIISARPINKKERKLYA